MSHAGSDHPVAAAAEGEAAAAQDVGLYQAHVNTIKTVLTAGLSTYLRQQGDPDPNTTLKRLDHAGLKRFEEVQHNGSSIAASILAGVAGADGLAVVHAPSRDMDRTNLCRHMLLVPRDVPEQRRLLNLGAVARCHHPVGAWSDCDLMVRDAAEVMGNLVAALTPPRPPVPAYDELSDAQSMLLALADNMAQVQTAMVRKGMHSPYDHIDVFESYVFAEQLGRDPAAFHVDLDEAQLLGLEKGEIELAPDFLLDARLAELLCNAISSRLADELDYKCEIAEAVAGTLDMDLADVLTVSDVIPRTLQLYGTVVPTSGDGNDLFYPDGSANPPVVAASLFERKKTAPQKLYELSNLRDALDLLLMLSDEEAEELCKAALGSPGNAIRKARALADKYVHIRNDAAREFLELFDAANEAVPVQVMAAAASVSLAFRGIVDPMVAQKMSNLLEKNETMGNPIFIALAGDTLRDKIVKEGQSYDGLTRMESQLGRVEADQLATMMLDVTVSNGDTIACRKPLNIPRPSLGNSDVWSYSVLVWEIVCAKTPDLLEQEGDVSGGPFLGRLVRQLERGARLKMGGEAPEWAQRVFAESSTADPQARPSFAAIVTSLEAVEEK